MLLPFNALGFVWPCLRTESRPQESAQGDKWSFCLTAGTLLPSSQEKP
jgi:hypothetical protein